MKTKILLLFIIALFSTLGLKAQEAQPCPEPSKRELPAFFYGATVEHIIPREDRPSRSFASIKRSVQALKINEKKPFIRIVFQWSKGQPFDYRVDEYRKALCDLREDAYIMGEILDSTGVSNCDVDCYKARTEAFVKKLGNLVDVWEIGNEINGEWAHPTDNRTIQEKNKEVGKKIEEAFKIMERAGNLSALTLYYNDDNNPDEDKRRSCWSDKDNEMFHWAKNYVSPELKRGLKYVLISYYNDPAYNGRKGDCLDDGKKLKPQWARDFTRLGSEDFFPNSKLGFGEVGTVIPGRKYSYIEEYYKTQTRNLTFPNYVGGYFWWYFEYDMVSEQTPVKDIQLLQKLRTVISENPR